MIARLNQFICWDICLDIDSSGDSIVLCAGLKAKRNTAFVTEPDHRLWSEPLLKGLAAFKTPLYLNWLEALDFDTLEGFIAISGQDITDNVLVNSYLRGNLSLAVASAGEATVS